jgi:serine/threonine protein kinase
MRSELDSLLRLSYDRLIRLFGHYECPNRYYIVIEYFKYGSLLDELSNEGLQSEFAA